MLSIYNFHFILYDTFSILKFLQKLLLANDLEKSCNAEKEGSVQFILFSSLILKYKKNMIETDIYTILYIK